MAPGSRLQELTAKYMQNPRRFFVPLANEYRIAGELDRAIALCREHLPAQPGHMSGHIVLGRAYFEKGDLDAARDVFLTSVTLDDENLIALRHLGDIARERADTVDARGWYARVLDADPENREIEQLLRSLDAPPSATAEPQWTAAATPVGFDVVPSLPTPVETPVIAPPGELASALADPTPPGLRAILGEDAAPAFDAALVRVPDAPPPAVSRPLETFDLASLGQSVEEELAGQFETLEQAESAAHREAATPAEEFGITVEGGGFAFSDLDEVVDGPTEATPPDTLPPIDEGDFSTGVETPAAVPAQPEPPDDILSRPVFGALASFASWRTAQERETPAGSEAQVASPTPVPTPELVASDLDEPLFWQGGSADEGSTAPEFVTETMAALYAQQGFTRQALDIYRTLLERSPGDVGLTMKVMQLQAALEAPVVDASLEADADQALEFGDASESVAPAVDAGSAFGVSDDVVPPTDADPLADAFGTAWSPAGDVALSAGDDWFADTADAGSDTEFTEVGSDIFGLATDSLAPLSADERTETTGSQSRAPSVALATVLGGSAVAAADDTAADMLSALASQMVGRLPKEPPTLPVPDVLEIPSARAAEGGSASATPAPLLSFDRFFSGSGSPPRPRPDTPARSSAITPRDLPAAPSVASPSLSPTFGGVPVIPPPSSVNASSWAGFDQFLPPAAPARPATPPQGAPAQPAPMPTGAFWTPAAVPVIPAQPTTTPAPTPVASVRPVTPPSAPVVPPAPPVDAPAPRRAPPSEFHAWLEGLS